MGEGWKIRIAVSDLCRVSIRRSGDMVVLDFGVLAISVSAELLNQITKGWFEISGMKNDGKAMKEGDLDFEALKPPAGFEPATW